MLSLAILISAGSGSLHQSVLSPSATLLQAETAARAEQTATSGRWSLDLVDIKLRPCFQNAESGTCGWGMSSVGYTTYNYCEPNLCCTRSICLEVCDMPGARDDPYSDGKCHCGAFGHKCPEHSTCIDTKEGPYCHCDYGETEKGSCNTPPGNLFTISPTTSTPNPTESTRTEPPTTASTTSTPKPTESTLTESPTSATTSSAPTPEESSSAKPPRGVPTTTTPTPEESSPTNPPTSATTTATPTPTASTPTEPPTSATTTSASSPEESFLTESPTNATTTSSASPTTKTIRTTGFSTTRLHNPPKPAPALPTTTTTGHSCGPQDCRPGFCWAEGEKLKCKCYEGYTQTKLDDIREQCVHDAGDV